VLVVFGAYDSYLVMCLKLALGSGESPSCKKDVALSIAVALSIKLGCNVVELGAEPAVTPINTTEYTLFKISSQAPVTLMPYKLR